VKFISSPSAVYTVSASYWEYLSDDDLCLGGYIFTEDTNGPTAMHILNRHLYHKPEPQDRDKPAMTILFSTLQEVIAHQVQQMYRSLNKKHQYNNADVTISPFYFTFTIYFFLFQPYLPNIPDSRT
jgi:hypothetical protein